MTAIYPGDRTHFWSRGRGIKVTVSPSGTVLRPAARRGLPSIPVARG